jgi:hypothetical protein
VREALIVIELQSRSRRREELTQRLHRFRLGLYPNKRRLVEFGCFAVFSRQRCGQGKPQPLVIRPAPSDRPDRFEGGAVLHRDMPLVGRLDPRGVGAGIN